MESFKRWLLLQEIHHVSIYEDGALVPFEVDGEEVIAIDMKFEHYPEEDLKNQLSHIDSKFYGKLPNQDLYLLRAPGKTTLSKSVPHGFIELPTDWWDRALAIYQNGNVKWNHPAKAA